MLQLGEIKRQTTVHMLDKATWQATKGPELNCTAMSCTQVGKMTSLTKLDLSGSAVHYLPFFISELQLLQAR